MIILIIINQVISHFIVASHNPEYVQYVFIENSWNIGKNYYLTYSMSIDMNTYIARQYRVVILVTNNMTRKTVKSKVM